MKKLISMVMAAAMVVSLVPATAFAANTATFKVVNDKEYRESEIDKTTVIDGPQLQLKLKDVDTTKGEPDDFDITLDFNNAELNNTLNKGALTVTGQTKVTGKDGVDRQASFAVKEKASKGDDTVKLTITENDSTDFQEDDIITIDLKDLGLVLTKVSKNTKATVEVSGDFGDSDELTFASVLDTGITVTLKKVAEVAEEETTNLEKDLTIKANVGEFAEDQQFEIKVSSGFEFTKKSVVAASAGKDYSIAKNADDDGKIIVTVEKTGLDEIVIDKDDIEIDAVSAKSGAVAKLTVKAIATKDNDATFKATADAVEAVKVVDNAVTLSVDEDDDLPVIYSGVDTNNYGITDDSDHESLEVTLKESAKGALDVKKSFTLTLPEGVYATNVEVTDPEGAYIVGEGTSPSAEDIENAFAAAYKKGDHDNFEFARKTFVATDDSSLGNNAKDMDLDFKLTLIAEPGFTGDVTLTLGGDAFDKEQTVKIAKFVSPYTIEAQQNDLIIDYRNTKVPTNVVIKEAEAGLWKKDDMTFDFEFDKDVITLEDDAKITVDDKSGMEVKNTKDMKFTVKDESDDAAATVTISDISLYMGRSIASGAYDLKVKTTAGKAMMTGVEGDAAINDDYAALFTTKGGETGTAREFAGLTGNDKVKPYFAADYKDWDVKSNNFVEKSFTVKEGFVNVITAGRDQDDASFTKKVVVPVGEKYLIAGEEQVALDVPAYISAAGYTMLPVRAVATALGINNNNVLWNQASRTVTILYGQRIITMVAGQKVVTVNGNTIPASATVQIKDGRTFLPMRDLATALGVTDITWDAATKTATMNGNQNK